MFGELKNHMLKKYIKSMFAKKKTVTIKNETKL
jgi:hypothetical protein